MAIIGVEEKVELQKSPATKMCIKKNGAAECAQDEIKREIAEGVPLVKNMNVFAHTHVVSCMDVSVQHTEATHATTGLKKREWDRLLSKLESKPEYSNHVSDKAYDDEWIIDSGASHHMTGMLNALVNVCRVSPCLVGLPNGNTVIADREGSVIMTEKLTLKRVLFVEELKCNLISVSQMIDEMNCNVLFSKTGCLMYDGGFQTVIRLGERRERLYFLQDGLQVRSGIGSWRLRIRIAVTTIIRKLKIIYSSDAK